MYYSTLISFLFPLSLPPPPLSLKTGEVWYEVGSELAQEGLRPTSPDQECLQEIIHCSEEKAEEVTRQQHELIDEQHRRDLDEEYQFYEQLRDAQISTERNQEKEEKLLMRTTNYKHLQVHLICSVSLTLSAVCCWLWWFDSVCVCVCLFCFV